MTLPTRELRHEVPTDVMDVLDGMARARGVTRGELLVAMLRRETDQAVHEATVVLRFARGHGPAPAPCRSTPE